MPRRAASRRTRGADPATDAQRPSDAKQRQLEESTVDARGEALTTNTGLRIHDDQDSLKAGDRGPTLLEDFHLREKITHFDHERIPERVVHARGSGAHGTFRVYKPLARYTRAAFLADPTRETPVFVRFSTVAGSRGSTDLARDVRGFAVKFYTDEGIFDLVGNNMPVFFIQDALKFPDLIHAVKPEPHNEMPQAASAHDTFWDFISLMPESMHMVMWLMSDRALPRSFRMMEGFGVHTFRLVDADGVGRFVKFHWKPLLGIHSVAWDEAQKISGKDPDFHRRDLWEAIDGGDYPEWELGIQIVEEADEFSLGFDLLDPTKLIPEELVPVQRVGRLRLDRNPENFFAETEQVAFHLGNIVPGIDLSNDPLLQGRLFSYLDTQLLRLGGANFHEIPINRSVAPTANHQRNGHMRQRIDRGRVSYQPNSLAEDSPAQVPAAAGGYVTYAESTVGTKVRARGESFFDHYSQARMFFRSQSQHEQQHLIKALRFELGKVTVPTIRERMVAHLAQIDAALATAVAGGLGIELSGSIDAPPNMSVAADAAAPTRQHRDLLDRDAVSTALSMANHVPGTIATRKVAALVAPDFDAAGLRATAAALASGGAKLELVGPNVGPVSADDGVQHIAQHSILTTSSVLFDAVYVVDGEAVAMWGQEADALDFLRDAFKHCKAIIATGRAVDVLTAAGIPTGADGSPADDATLVGSRVTRALLRRFTDALGSHRLWAREPELHLPI